MNKITRRKMSIEIQSRIANIKEEKQRLEKERQASVERLIEKKRFVENYRTKSCSVMNEGYGHMS